MTDRSTSDNAVKEPSYKLSQTGPTVFRYQKPSTVPGKQVVVLARTDRMFAGVQVLTEGGENNLHKHPLTDGCWLVLNGRVRFYGANDVVLAELGKHEGILIPRGTLYWFESCSEEELEILQFDAFDRPMPNLDQVIGDRVNAKPDPRDWKKKVLMHDGRVWKS